MKKIRIKKTYEPIETDFHSVKCHWNEKMLLSLYEPLRDNSIYKPAETKNDPLGARIISVAEDGFDVIIKDKDPGSFREDKKFNSEHSRSITRVAIWESSKSQIITASADGTLRCFDFEGRFLRSMEGHTKRINCLIVTPTEAYEDTIVISGSADTTVRYWRLKTGKLHVLCNGHKWEVISVCFCKGRGVAFELVACSMDRKFEVRLWDSETGDCFRVLNEAIPPLEPLNVVSKVAGNENDDASSVISEGSTSSIMPKKKGYGKKAKKK